MFFRNLGSIGLPKCEVSEMCFDNEEDEHLKVMGGFDGKPLVSTKYVPGTINPCNHITLEWDGA